MITTVLGMQHSGTSCFAEALMKSGVYFGAEGELRGWTHEKRDIVLLHSKYIDWTEPKPWGGDEKAREERAQIVDRYGAVDWGFKDPMTLFALEFWKELRDIRFVGTFRHPRAVIGYFMRVCGLRPLHAERLWVTYNSVLLQEHDTKPFPIVCFDWEEARYADAVRGIVSVLGLDDQAKLVDFSKREEGKAYDGPILDTTMKLYETLFERSFKG